MNTSTDDFPRQPPASPTAKPGLELGNQELETLQAAVLEWENKAIENTSEQDKQRLLESHPSLEMAFQARNQTLAGLYTQLNLLAPEQAYRLFQSKHQLIYKQILTCLKLRFIYQHFLQVPTQVLALTKKISVLQSLLETQHSQRLPFNTQSHQAMLETSLWLHPFRVSAWQRFGREYFSFSAWRDWWSGLEFSTRTFREQFAKVNWLRLFTVRVKRIFDVLFPLSKSYRGFSALNRVFSYLAWLFYVPRFLNQMYLLMAHSFTWFFGGERALRSEENGLNWLERLSAQWQRRWFDILNDAVWITVGLLCCFVLNPLPAMILTVGLYAFDLTMTLVRRHKVNQKYMHLLASVDEKISVTKNKLAREPLRNVACLALEARLSRLEDYQQSLQEQRAYAYRSQTIAVLTTASIWLGMIASLALMLTPVPTVALGVMAAAWVVVTCIASRVAEKKLALKKPFSELSLNIRDEVKPKQSPLPSPAELAHALGAKKPDQPIRRSRTLPHAASPKTAPVSPGRAAGAFFTLSRPLTEPTPTTPPTVSPS